MADSATPDAIRERVDIVELVREYVPALKKAGRTFKACCPFHSEKTPSFTVNQEKGLFYCFGCQTGGDVFAFLMKMENLSFPEAGEKLAKRAGLEWRRAEAVSPEQTAKQEARHALDFAREYYHKTLLTSPQAAAARDYLAKRGVNAASVKKFELGFSPMTGLVPDALKAGHKNSALEKAGLLGKNPEGDNWEYFRGRLMFPIKNHRGDTVGFGGRSLDGKEPKYLNSPDTPVFSKSRVLFGLSQAGPAVRKEGRILLLEGYMDVLACHQYGLEWAAAPLGTAVNEEHGSLIKRYCGQAVMLFDPDAAGIKAALRAALILTECGVYVKVAALPDGLDPDEFLVKHGLKELQKIISAAKDTAQFHAGLLLGAAKQPLGPGEKARLADELLETIRRQPDEIIRSEWLKFSAEKLGIKENVLRSRLGRPAAKAAAPAEVSDDMPVEERDIIKYLLRFPEKAALCSALSRDEFSNRRARDIFGAVFSALDEGIPASSLVPALSEKLPAEAAFLARLSVEELPGNFDSGKDIADCANRVKRSEIQREFEKLQKEIAQASGQGKDATALLKERSRLAVLLKSGRRQGE